MPDSIVPEAMKPQALNRYSYYVSNPLKYIDPSGHDYDDDYWGGIPVPGDAGASGASYSSSPSLPLGQMTPQLAQFMMEQQGAAQGPYWDTYPSASHPAYCGPYTNPIQDVGHLVDQITSDWNGFDYARTATSLTGTVAGWMSDVPGASFVATRARPVAAVFNGAAGYERELAADGGHSEGRAAAVGISGAAANLLTSTIVGARTAAAIPGWQGKAIGAGGGLVTGIAVQTGTSEGLRGLLDWLGIK